MNRVQYLKELSKYLDKLPREEYEDAMNCFEEYFDETGVEGEADLINELGHPRVVASEILSKLMNQEHISENHTEKQAKKKKRFSSVFKLSILYILAAPIGIPLTIAFIAIVFSIVIVIGSIILSFAAFSLSGLLITIKTFFIGLLTVKFSISGAMTLIGVSIVSVAIAVIFAIITVWLSNFLSYSIKKIISLLTKKRGEIR